MLDVASLWAGALACGGVGALAAFYMQCFVKETLVKAGARGPYELVAEDDAEDEVRRYTRLLLGTLMPTRPGQDRTLFDLVKPMEQGDHEGVERDRLLQSAGAGKSDADGRESV